MEIYCSLCTFMVPQGANNLILCTLDTIHRLFFVTRLIINKINKVQWVDFKLENVLVSLHSLKIMEPRPLGAEAHCYWVTWTFSYTESFHQDRSLNTVPIIGTWFLNNRNFKLFLTNTNVTSRSLNIYQLVNIHWAIDKYIR
jgi:hypothetical protein